jgi:hypothetical protein
VERATRYELLESHETMPPSCRQRRPATASVSWVIDLTPLVITIQGVADGGCYYGSATPVIIIIIIDETYPAAVNAAINDEPLTAWGGRG